MGFCKLKGFCKGILFRIYELTKSCHLSTLIILDYGLTQNDIIFLIIQNNDVKNNMNSDKI